MPGTQVHFWVGGAIRRANIKLNLEVTNMDKHLLHLEDACISYLRPETHAYMSSRSILRMC